MYEIGNRIKMFRMGKGLSQKDFARLIGAKSTTVSNWEKGLTRPDVDTFAAICSALGVSADELLDIRLTSEYANLSQDQSKLLASFSRLSMQGRVTALHQVEALTNLYPLDAPDAKKMAQKANSTSGESEVAG